MVQIEPNKSLCIKCVQLFVLFTAIFNLKKKSEMTTESLVVVNKQ